MAAGGCEVSINLLLVGQPGDGKRSTANSIIGQRKFKSSPSFGSATNICQREVTTIQGHNVVVVYSPHVHDSHCSDKQDLDHTATEITRALAYQPDGFDAILIVILYGKSLTEEDRRVIEVLETFFGTDYTKHFGILIVTHADNYIPEENDDMPIEEFLQRETGVFQILREKCNNRLIAFDNQTRDVSVRQNQVKRILDMVIEMRIEADHYTLCSLSKDLRADIESQAKIMPVGLEETMKKLMIFLEDHKNIPLRKFNVNKLTEIQTKFQTYRKELIEKNTCTKRLTSLLSKISSLEDAIIARTDNIRKETGPEGGQDKSEHGDDNTYRIGEDFINFLLVGKTGQGKSSTGNSILGEKKFKTTASFTSGTKSYQREVATVQGHNVVIVDSPGLADTDIETDGGLKQLANEIIDIFAAQPDGFDVILITIPFGKKITAEDKRVFQELDRLLGNEYVNHCGILVVSHMDRYDPEENGPIEEFMEKQTGEFQHLRQNRVNNRVVCFDNKTKDDSVRQAQVKQLLDVAVGVKKDPQTFIPEVCVTAQKTRDEALKKVGKPVIRSKTTDKLTLIIRESLGIHSESKDTQQLESIITKLQELHTKLKEQVEDEEMQDNLIFTVRNLERAIRMKISAVEKDTDVKIAEKNIQEELSALAQLLITYEDLKYSLLSKELRPALATFIHKTLGISSLFKKIIRTPASFVSWLRKT